MDRELCVVIQNQHQLVALALPTRRPKIELVAKLSSEEGWLERGTDGESEVLVNICQTRNSAFRLEKTKRYECR